MGGLGNQLFQYAAYLWAKQHFPDCRVSLDMNVFKYSVEHFGIEINKIFEIDDVLNQKIAKIKTSRNPQSIFRTLDGFVHKIFRKLIGVKSYFDCDIKTPTDFTQTVTACGGGHLRRWVFSKLTLR